LYYQNIYKILKLSIIIFTGIGPSVEEFDRFCDANYNSGVLSCYETERRGRLVYFVGKFPDIPNKGVYAGVFDMHNKNSGTSIRNLMVVRSSSHGPDNRYRDCTTPKSFGISFQRTNTNVAWGPITEIGYSVIELKRKTLQRWSEEFTKKYGIREPIVDEEHGWASFHFFEDSGKRRLEEIMKQEGFTFV
jgi:hypothetical protein